MSGDILFVPVSLNGLIVGRNNSSIANLTQNYDHISRIGRPPLSASIMNGFYSTIEEKAGIHLHWTMPDALLHGVQDESGKLHFPRLPNRWIIQRICLSNSTPKWKAWMVESDYCSTTESVTSEGMFKATIPAFKYDESKGLWTGTGQKGEKFFYLGSARRFGDTPSISGTYLDELTAVGMGDHLFAGYYQKCKTVFGFYDSMTETENGEYTYIISGYYSKREHDPIGGVKPKTVEELGWRTIGNVKPKSIICHSVLQGVTWKGHVSSYDFAAPAGKIEIGVANTTAEAMSRFIQQKMPESANLERILNALQYGSLKELDNPENPDALINFEEMLHEKQFSVAGTTSVWRLRKKSENTEASLLTEALYQWLQSINNKQAALNDYLSEFDTLGQEAYMSWYKYVTKAMSPFNADFSNDEGGISSVLADLMKSIDNAPNAGECLKRVTALVENLEKYRDNIESTQKEIDALTADESMNGKLAEKHMILEKTTDGQSYIPNDPVILLSGDGMKRSQKLNTQDGEFLQCRTEVLEGLSALVEKNIMLITADDILKRFAGADISFAKLEEPHKTLLTEAILLNPDFAELLSGIALEKLKIANPNARQIKEAADAILKAKETEANYKGILPCTAIISNKWRQPWLPLIMIWTVEIAPLRSKNDADDSFSKFKPGTIDLEWNKEKPTCETVEIQGSTLLTPHGPVNLRQSFDKLIADYGDDGNHYETLKEVVSKISGLEILSQRIDGFSDALIMRDNFPMIPICRINEESETTAANLVKLLNGVMPSPRIRTNCSNYLPVRAGLMNISRLWIVDSFGQIKKVIDKEGNFATDVYAAESISSTADGFKALLRPRFLQTCETRFTWLRHDKEEQLPASSDSTPVFGFISPNFLDLSLFIYDSTALLLGTIQYGNNMVKWMNVPGSICQSPDDIKSIHLKQFVNGIINVSSASFRDFLVYLDKKYSNIATQGSNSFLQLCFGKVIALARASIKIDAKGTPPYAQLWSTEQNSLDYLNEKFKICIGDSRKLNDGTIGFFPDSGSKPDYSRLCIEPVKEFEKSQYLKCSNIIETTLANDATKMSVLLDLSGHVTIRTGFLPTCKTSLHPDLYRDQLEKMEMMFRLAPILSPASSLELYIPGRFEDMWSFNYIDRTRKLANISEITLPDVLPPIERIQAREGFLKTNNNFRNGDKNEY